MARGIFKNISTLSFKGFSIKGVKNFSVTVDADVDRDTADNETESIIYGVQNYRGTAEAEVGDLKDISSQISVGQSGSLRGTADAKYTNTETNLTIVIATAYCIGLDFGIPHGDAASARVSWEFNTTGLSYA